MATVAATSFVCLLFLSGAGAGMLFEGGAPFCEDGWLSTMEGYCVLPVTQHKSWPEARHFCYSKMARLYNPANVSRVVDQFGEAQALGSVLLQDSEFWWTGMYVDEDMDRLMWDDYGPHFVVKRAGQEHNAWRWEEGGPISRDGSCGNLRLGILETNSTSVPTFFEGDLNTPPFPSTTSSPSPFFEGDTTTPFFEGGPDSPFFEGDTNTPFFEGDPNTPPFSSTSSPSSPFLFPGSSATPSVKQFSDTLYMGLKQCDVAYPFVCQKEKIVASISQVSTCEKGWVGNVYVTTCFRIPQENANYTEAKHLCSVEGGSLVSWSSNSSLTSEIVKYYITDDPFFNTTRIEAVWLETPSSLNGTLGVSCFAYRFGNMRNLSCGIRVNFMCQKKALSPIQQPVDINVTSAYFNQEDPINYPALVAYSIIGMFNRPPSDIEFISVRTPSEVLSSKYPEASTRFSMAFSPSWSSPYHVMVTFTRRPRRRRALSMVKQSFLKLVREIILRRKKRQDQGVPLLSDDDLVDNVGFYQFSYNSLNSLAVSSVPMLVRFSEKYLLIYVLYLTVPLGGFSITAADIESRNLLNDYNYTSVIQESLGNVFSQPEEAWWIQSYRYKIEHIDGMTSVIKVRYFITYGRENITDLEEQEMLMIMKNHLSASREEIFAIRSSVLSTVACPAFKENNATFESARIGVTRYSYERCFGGNGALAFALCEGSYVDGAKWGEVIYASGCSDPPISNETSASTTELKRLSEINVETDNFVSILNETVILTSPDVNLTSNDVILVADILYNQLQFPKNVTPVIDDIFSITNNVLSAPTGVIAETQTIDYSANRIIRSTEELAASAVPPNGRDLRVVKPFVAAEIWEQTGSETDFIIGFALTATQFAEKGVIQSQDLKSVGEANGVVINNTDAGIYLRRGLLASALNSRARCPPTALVSVTMSERVERAVPPTALVEITKTKLVFQMYGKTSLFSGQNNRYHVSSKVAAAKLFIGGVETFDLNDGDVTAVFTPSEYGEDLVCGFWNYSANQDAGGWDTSGCKTSRDGEQIVCKCNHLTNFAVLIDLEAHSITDRHKKILDIVTKVGLIVSISALCLTIVTFILYTKRTRPQQILINLSVAVLCSSIVFLVGIERTESRVICKAVASILHYFILSSFMWTLVQGVVILVLSVKTTRSKVPKSMLKTMIFAWGLPPIPVIVCLAIDHELMYTGEKGYCWLQNEAMLYAFLIPVAVIMTVNIIIFLVVTTRLQLRNVIALWGMKRQHKEYLNKQSEEEKKINNKPEGKRASRFEFRTNQCVVKTALVNLRTALAIFLLNGLTWVFGFFAMTGEQIEFHYLFASFNAFQGLFIFMTALIFNVGERKKCCGAWTKCWTKCCTDCCGRKETFGKDKRQKKVSSGTTESTGFSSTDNTLGKSGNGGLSIGENVLSNGDTDLSNDENGLINNGTGLKSGNGLISGIGLGNSEKGPSHNGNGHMEDSNIGQDSDFDTML